MTNNMINGKGIYDSRYSVRPDMGKSSKSCKLDYTDPYLSSEYCLTQEELDFLGKFIHHDFYRMLRFYPRLIRARSFFRDFYLDTLFHAFNGIRFCQSSFDSYQHLADEDEIEEERQLYDSEDLLEHGFYAREIRRWQMELDRRRIYEEALLPKENPVETVTRPVNIELLGCYFPYQTNNNNDVPEVHLFMDNITETARRMRCPRKYIVVAVFLHEMCHALFDRFPLLLPKPYIQEIEEPIAECLSLEILYSFVEASRFFYPHGELLNVFDTAYSMVYAKRRLKKRCYYSLGIELFHSDLEICLFYNCFSYLLNEQSQAVKDYVSDFANGFPKQPYNCIPKLGKLLNYK
jgi:hypothetical protein